MKMSSRIALEVCFALTLSNQAGTHVPQPEVPAAAPSAVGQPGTGGLLEEAKRLRADARSLRDQRDACRRSTAKTKLPAGIDKQEYKITIDRCSANGGNLTISGRITNKTKRKVWWSAGECVASFGSSMARLQIAVGGGRPVSGLDLEPGDTPVTLRASKPLPFLPGRLGSTNPKSEMR